MSNVVYVGTLGSSPPRSTLAPVVQGSTESLHTITVKYADDSTAYNLTGKTVTGIWWKSALPSTVYAITGTIAVTNAAGGIFTWDKSAADVGTSGTVAVQFIITDDGDSETDATFPASMAVEARGDANAVAGSALVAIASSVSSWLTSLFNSIGGVTSASEDNVVTFDANGIPQDSGVDLATLGGDYQGHINLRDIGHVAEAGDLWDDGNALHYVPVADERSLSLANGVLMSSVTVANTTTETTVYTETINANEMYKGSKWHVKMSGLYSTANASDTFTARLKIGGTTLEEVTIDAGNATNRFWRIEFFFTVRTVGETGTIVTAVEASTGGVDHSNASTTADTVDTTVQEDMTLTIQWDAANANNTVTITQGHTEIFGVKQA